MINPKTQYTSQRRHFLGAMGAATLGGCAMTPQTANAKPAPGKTPAETEGPFYPTQWQGDTDNNLIKLDGSQAYNLGTPMQISGTILRPDGSPAAGARVEIWQTDHNGRYRHPDDAGEAPAKAGFQGFGRTVTNSEGRYQFQTIKPVRYGSRPPHVHFRVVDDDIRLTTQMYFPGETKEGGVLGRIASSVWASDRSQLTAKITQANAGLDAQFDLFL